MDKSKRLFCSFGISLWGGVLFLAGCGNGSSVSGSGSGIVALGKTRVNGNVVSNKVTGRIDGVGVTAGDRNTSTDSKGLFELVDVPPGTIDVRFTTSGVSSSIRIDLADSSAVNLKNVRISGTVASADSVSVSPSTSSGGNGSSGSSSDDDSSDDDSSDDNNSGSGSSGSSSDDDSSDDNNSGSGSSGSGNDEDDDSDDN